MSLDHISPAQSARIGEIIVTVFQAGRDAGAEEASLLRAELESVKSAWRDLWEKAGRPAEVPTFGE